MADGERPALARGAREGVQHRIVAVRVLGCAVQLDKSGAAAAAEVETRQEDEAREEVRDEELQLAVSELRRRGVLGDDGEHNVRVLVEAVQLLAAQVSAHEKAGGVGVETAEAARKK